MSKTFSRAHLQTLPETAIQTRMDQFVRLFQSQVLASAQHGFTSYFVDIDMSQLNQQSCRPSCVRPATEQDVVAAFQRLFPDCDVVFMEDWIETRPGTKELKKGVRVDWS